MSKDYKALQSEMAGDLSAAAHSVSLNKKGGTREVRLPKSDLPSLIPDGAALDVQGIKFTKLQMGDIICVSAGRGLAVRRFVKMKMTKADTYLLTAFDGAGKKEALPHSALMGKVVLVTAKGRTYDPHKEENPISAFWGRLTEYGTHKAFGLFG